MHQVSRLSSLFVLLVAVGVGGCKKPDETGKPTGNTSAPVTAGKAGAATAGVIRGTKVDKASGQDGPLKPDGTDDDVISLTIDGPVSALAVVSVSKAGEIEGGQQWDTVVENTPMPAAWKVSFETGGPTWQLGVEEAGKPLNAKNGSLVPLAAGTHKLTLYITPSGYFEPGKYLMVLAERPDHSIVKSNTFTK
jgi:hypothetical protein